MIERLTRGRSADRPLPATEPTPRSVPAQATGPVANQAESGPSVPADPVPDGDLGPARHYDPARVEECVRELLLAIGEDPDRPGLKRTPERVARALAEQYAGLHTDPSQVLETIFDEGHEEMVIVRDIELYSTCEHHLVPFHGVAHVGYIPNELGQITGLSKLARVVDLYARRPQVQERLTSQVADAVARKLSPRGVIVVIEAEHLCMTMRGVHKPGAKTVTSAVRGLFDTCVSTRAEAMSLILGR